MTNKEIVEGLKAAVSRGESLKQAMMSFLNAGYNRKEIQEAAREVQSLSIQKVQSKPEQKPLIKKSKKPFLSRFKSKKKLKPVPIRKPIQKVSQYEQKLTNQKKSLLRSKWFVIILVTLLLISIAGLVAILLF